MRPSRPTSLAALGIVHAAAGLGLVWLDRPPAGAHFLWLALAFLLVRAMRREQAVGPAGRSRA